MKKIFTLCLMIMLLTMVLFIKHLSAQNLWAENSKTNQRRYLKVNQQISYKLNTSINFHKGRIVTFTDTTLTVQIKGDKLVTLLFRKLSAIKVTRSGGRMAGGVLLISMSALSLVTVFAANSYHSTPPSYSGNAMTFGSLGPNLSNEINKEVSTAGIAVALVTLPIGIALLDGKTINLNKDWTLKTK